MPGVFCAFATIGLITLIRYDTPKFYLYSKENELKAKRAIHSMYLTQGNDDAALRIASAIKKQSTSETNKVTL